MPQPRDILDAPGPLPGEPVTPPDVDPYADDTPEERAARKAWPELPWTPGEYLRAIYGLGCVRIFVPRAWFDAELSEPVTWTVGIGNGQQLVLTARIHGRPDLTCVEPATATLEGTYLPTRSR
jgi:hypothetical protein